MQARAQALLAATGGGALALELLDDAAAAQRGACALAYDFCLARVASIDATLAAWDAGQTGMLLDSPADVVSRVLELTAPANGLVAGTSKAMRAQLAGLQPLAPLVFHVFVDSFPQASDAERRESMLAALEAQAGQFRLLALEIPDFDLDDERLEDGAALKPLADTLPVTELALAVAAEN